MAEPAADHVDLDASLEKVNGGGVAEGVRADPATRSGVIEAGGVPSDDLVDARAGETLAVGRNTGAWGPEAGSASTSPA